MSPFCRVLTYLYNYPWLALGTILYAIMSMAIVAAFPVVTEHIIDSVLQQGHADQLPFLIILGISTFFLQAGMEAKKRSL